MILYLAYMGLSFWLFNGNLLSPSIIFSSSLSLMLCLAYYAASTMGMLFAIEMRTFTVFAISGFLFIAAELCVYLFRTSTCTVNNPVTCEVKREPLIISRQTQILITCFFVLSLILMIYAMYASTSGGSWSSRMREYKNLIYTNSGAIKFRAITSQLYKINLIMMDLLGYVMIYNLTICNVRVKEVLSYVIDTACFTVHSAVFNGGRQGSVEVILFLMTVYVLVNMKMIPVPLLIGAIFSSAGEFVGRGETTKDPFIYVVEYLCGGLYYFNYRIINRPASLYFGQSTFSYAYNVIFSVLKVPYDFKSKHFVDFELYGNTITVFGRWYEDFGMTGTFIIIFIVSLCYSSLFYYRLIYSNNIRKENHLSRIFYSQFVAGLIWACYDDRIAPIFSVQTIVFLIFTPFFFWLLITKRCKLF